MVHVHKRPYVLRCLACRQHYVARVSPGRDILYWVRYDANELRAKVHGAIIAVMINNGYRTEFGERAAAAIAESMEQKPRRMMALPPHEKGRDDGTE
jgi:hypothetical protein